MREEAILELQEPNNLILLNNGRRENYANCERRETRDPHKDEPILHDAPVPKPNWPFWSRFARSTTQQNRSTFDLKADLLQTCFDLTRWKRRTRKVCRGICGSQSYNQS